MNLDKHIMHKGVLLLSKVNTKEEALEKVSEFM